MAKLELVSLVDRRPEIIITREVLNELVLEGFRLDLLDHLQGREANAPNPAVYGIQPELAQEALLSCLDEDGIDLRNVVVIEGGAELASWAA
jgi:hypothetical protein